MQEPGRYEFLKEGRVPVAWREPFSEAPMYRQYSPAGETVDQIVRSVPGLPADFLERGIVCINAREVKREDWTKWRPLPDRPQKPIMVTLYMPPAGGGGGRGVLKQVLGLVASIALLFATAGIAGGALAAGGYFAAGSLSAKVLAGAVGLIGALAISALSAPPAAKKQPADETKEASSADGNSLDPGGAISCVVGTRKVFPNLIGEPIVELVGPDEIVSACYVLNGPHRLDSPKIADSPIDDVSDVVYETREGWPDDPPLTLFTRQGRTTAPQIQLSEHVVDPDDGTLLKQGLNGGLGGGGGADNGSEPTNPFDSNKPQDKIPRFHSVATRRGPEEVWLHLLMPGGLGRNVGTAINKSVPVRIRIKPRGGDWINLPEIHLTNNVLKQLRYGIVLKFGQEMPDEFPRGTNKAGWCYARTEVPGQSFAPTDDGWTAHDYFIGSGPVYMTDGNKETSGVLNTTLGDSQATFYLNGDVFPSAIYDIQIKRGLAYVQADFSTDTYVYDSFNGGSGTWNFFSYKGTVAPYEIASTQENCASQMVLVRVVSIWNQYPIQAKGFALLALQALNKRVDALSILASRYVKDWDGTGWNTWTTTSNPAPHYADVLCGAQNLDPLPLDLRDDAALVDWRQRCVDNDWTCDAIIEDVRTQDVLLLLASSAYARPYQSEKYGVTVDYDRTGATPTQVFSQRNSRDFRFEKAFVRRPDGMVVNYSDVEADYDPSQIIVFRRGYDGGPNGILETVTYDGLVDEDKVRTRTQFDLDQAELRSTFHYLTTGAIGIRCRRGDLVGMQNDILVKRSGAAIIKTIFRAGGDVIGFGLDLAIDVQNNPNMHDVTYMSMVDDMHTVGLVAGLAVRRSDDTLSVHEIADATGFRDVITLSTPIEDPGTFWALDETDGKKGSQIVSGDLGSQYRRMLVSGISPKKDYGFDITLVDEAPELVRMPGMLLVDDDGDSLTDDDGDELMDD